MFFCDPFGHTQPENLFNHGTDDYPERDYVFCHDQEPIQLSAHRLLFNDVIRRNMDLQSNLIDANLASVQGHVIVSEQGEKVKQLEDIYGWRSHYYFFHGWACLDWFRGYNRTFLFPPPHERQFPSTTFMCPNRIIGGEREHRVLFLYHVIKQGLAHNHISAPYRCPVEDQCITDLGAHYQDVYPDIQSVLSSAGLPWLYQGEAQQLMTSCWLSNYAEAMDSMIYVPTETVFFDRRLHLTEKTFKAIALGLAFVMVAPAHSLEYLRGYGFRTFGDIWDESYDQETDDMLRLEKVVNLLKDLDQLSRAEKNSVWTHCLPIVKHNWDHFYHGGFEKVLWRELQGMFNGLRL